MKTFHGTNGALVKIESGHVFGGVFTSESKRAASSHGDTIVSVISAKPLSQAHLVSIEGAYDVALRIADGSEAIAESIMSAECDDSGIEMDLLPEQTVGWELQRLRGALARALGFTSVEMSDEHGTTWLCLPACVVESGTRK